MLRKLTIVLSFIFLCGSTLYAAPILSVGDYEVQQGVFKVDIMLSNISDQVLGEEFDFFGFRLEISPQDGGLTFSDPLSYSTGDAIHSDNRMWTNMVRNDDTNVSASYAVFSGEAHPFTDGLICTVDLLANELGLYKLNLVDYEFGHGWTPGQIEVQNGSVNVNVNPIPIPSTLLLLGTGLMGLMGLRRRKLNR